MIFFCIKSRKSKTWQEKKSIQCNLLTENFLSVSKIFTQTCFKLWRFSRLVHPCKKFWEFSQIQLRIRWLISGKTKISSTFAFNIAPWISCISMLQFSFRLSLRIPSTEFNVILKFLFVIFRRSLFIDIPIKDDWRISCMGRKLWKCQATFPQRHEIILFFHLSVLLANLWTNEYLQLH